MKRNGLDWLDAYKLKNLTRKMKDILDVIKNFFYICISKMNKYTLWIVLAVVIVVVYFWFKNTESYTEGWSTKRSELSSKIASYIKPETQYTEYLDFINKLNNTSYKILEQEVFYTLKFLAKQGGLTAEAVGKEMTDI